MSKSVAIDADRLAREISADLAEMLKVDGLSPESCEIPIGEFEGIQVQIKLTKNADDFLDYETGYPGFGIVVALKEGTSDE